MTSRAGVKGQGARECEKCPKEWRCIVACAEVNAALNQVDAAISASERGVHAHAHALTTKAAVPVRTYEP